MFLNQKTLFSKRLRHSIFNEYGIHNKDQLRKIVAQRQKSELLNNIELLWQEASMQSHDSNDDQAQSTFQRINALMHDALSVEKAANDALPQPHKPSHNQAQTPVAIFDNAIDDHADLNETETDISALAELVHEASDKTDSASLPPEIVPFEDVKAQMDDVSRLKPPQEDNSKISSVEYDFGQAFTNLVRHVVRDYIHNEVEQVIRNAIKSELDAHFTSSYDHESSDINRMDEGETR